MISSFLSIYIYNFSYINLVDYLYIRHELIVSQTQPCQITAGFALTIYICDEQLRMFVYTGTLY